MCLIKRISESRRRTSRVIKTVLRSLFGRSHSVSMESIDNIKNSYFLDHWEEIAENEANEALSQRTAANGQIIFVTKTKNGTFYWHLKGSPVDADLFVAPVQ